MENSTQNETNYFKCYKCGYSYVGEEKIVICPRCKTDNTLPKIGLITLAVAFLTFILLIVSIFNYDLSFLAFIGLVATFILVPFAFMDSLKRSGIWQDGFVTPQTPSDVIRNNARVPDFIFLDYIDGVKFDYNIKKLIFDVAPDNLIIYSQDFNEIATIDYSKISDINLYNNAEYKFSYGKTILSAAVGAILFGTAGGLVGGVLGGIKPKDLYVIEIEVNKDDNTTGCIQASGKKAVLENMFNRINYLIAH